ncbi:MAG TPA: YihY/virulence factor BrkB family protein [Longimicrobiales bacterium]|nr:YihY/virulence factor BrkB family protein [Longimicrobiales bacterium]
MAPSIERSRLRRAFDDARRFLALVYQKAAEDRIFFLAGAIAFNVLVAFVPLILAVLGITTAVLRQQNADVTGVLMNYVMGALPDAGEDFREKVRTLFEGFTDASTGLLGIGTVFFVWIATRLVGTLRTVLGEVFDLTRDRGIIAGKLFDLKMVVAAGSLFAVNVGVTIILNIIAGFGREMFGFDAGSLGYAGYVWAQLIAFGFIWVMFLMIYRYLPLRRIGWRTVIIAASFTAVLFELMKQGFSVYAQVADYGSVYGNLTFLLILIFWIYYAAVVFILGGVVAQVATMQRIRRQQRERLT